MKKQNFITGALILASANAVSKILGAVFKIPLSYILREEGMGIYSAAFSAYILALSPIVSGIPFAASKLTAEEIGHNRYGSAKTIAKLSTGLLMIVGAAISILLYVYADFFAGAMKDPKAALAIRAISPSVFLVAAGAGVKGVFQGTQNMIPTAASQVAESAIKLAAGYGLALLLANCSKEITAAGAISGVTVGELAATAFLIIMFVLENQGGKSLEKRELFARLMGIAAPMTVIAVISGAMSAAETIIVRRQLSMLVFTPQTAEKFFMQYSPYTGEFDNVMRDLRLGTDGARWLWGAYSGYAMTVFNLPVGILATLSATLLPVIAGAEAAGDKERAARGIRTGLIITFLISVPCAALMMLMPETILGAVFRNTSSQRMLAALAPAVIPVSAGMICSSALQAKGRLWIPFINMTAAYILRTAAAVILCRNPEYHIMGAAIAANAGAWASFLFNYVCLKKYS